VATLQILLSRQASDARAVNTTHVGFGMPFWLVVGGVRVDTKC